MSKLPVLLLLASLTSLGAAAAPVSLQPTSAAAPAVGIAVAPAEGPIRTIQQKKELVFDNPDYDPEYLSPELKKVTYTLEVDLQWPERVAGCTNMAALHQALLKRLFPEGTYANVDAAVDAFINKTITADDLGGPFDPGEYLSLRMLPAKKYYVQFETILGVNMGSGTGAGCITGTSYVIFDKTTQRALRLSDLIQASSATIVAQLNKRILQLNRQGKQYDKCTEVPDTYYLSNRGIVFVFPKYTIGCGADGEVEIDISLLQAPSIFTAKAKKLIGNR